METPPENIDHLLPPFFLTEREDLIHEIYVVFGNVTLGEGRTWGESAVEDFWSRDDEEHNRRLQAARDQEEGRSWQEWTDDPNWYPHQLGGGGFNFLDEEGARFYLPGAMIKTLQEGDGNALAWWLAQQGFYKGSGVPVRCGIFLDEPQCECVRCFLRYMIAVSSYVYGESHEMETWWVPLEDRW